MDQIRIVKEMRDECRKSNQPIRPRYLVWENVVGAFSSGNPGGSDFQAVLEEICKIVRHECPVVPIPKDGWPSAGNLDGVGDDGTPFSICWRVHDAQYWGVAQRRRRVSLVADFGGTSAPEILFEPYGVSGNSKQSKEEGQGTSRNSANRSGATGNDCLGDTDRKQVEEFLSAVNKEAKHQQDLIQSDLGVANTLAPGTHASGPHLTKTLVTGDPKVYGIGSYDSAGMKSDNPNVGIYEADTSRTLDNNGGNPACNQGGMAIVQGADVYIGELTGEVAASLTTASGISNGSGPKAVIFTQNEREEVRDLDGVAGAISTESGTHQQNYAMQPNGECLNSWDVQSKHIQPEDGIAESLYSGECRYGGGESYVLQNQTEPILLESNQNHATVQTDGVSTSLPASMGEGGGYVPMVCIEGNGSRESHKGDGYIESETMYTLNTVEQHAVAYSEPVPETYQKTTGALMASGYSKLGTQEAANDMYVVQQPTVQSMELFHCTTEEELAAPLKARDYKDPQVVAFEPGAASRVGGHVYEDGKAGTLRADMGDNQQAIVHSAGFCTEHSANARSIGYQEEIAPTLREGVVPATIYGFDAYNQQETGDVAKSLNSAATDSDHIPCVLESKAVESHAQDARYSVGDVNQTLGANMEHDPANGGLVYAVDEGGGKSQCAIHENVSPTLATTHHGEPAVCYESNRPVVFKKSAHAKTADDGQGWESTEVNDTLNAFDNGETRTPTLVLNDQGGQQMQVSEDSTATLRAEEHGHQPMVLDMLNLDPKQTEKCMTLNAYNGTGGNNTPMVLENHPNDSRVKISESGVVQTLSGRMGTGGGNTPMLMENSEVSKITRPQQAVVRRLTCLECTRLQGFPDGWCDIGDWVDSKGKKHKDSDSPKYKALGNSIALPFWDWMAGRMVAQLKKSGVENPTMASLFDGISGFCYVYIRHGCMPLWTSEIEEYPIAVCKRHFGDEDTGETGDIDEYLKLPPNWATSSSTSVNSTNTPISFDRAAFNQGANAKYDFAVDDNDKAQTIVSRGPGGVCQ